MQAEWFTQVGLFVTRDSFDAALCDRPRAGASASAGAQATVRRRGAEFVVDESLRRTRFADVPAASIALITERLRAVQPKLARYFEVETRGCRHPNFLVYCKGDSFKPHAEVSRDADAPHIATGRRTSMVVFLNDETAEPGPEYFCGGPSPSIGCSRFHAGKRAARR